MSCQSFLINTPCRPLAVIVNPCTFNLIKSFTPADSKGWFLFISTLRQRLILFLVCSWPLLIEIPLFKAESLRRPLLLTPQTRKKRVELQEKEFDADFLGQCEDGVGWRRELYWNGERVWSLLWAAPFHMLVCASGYLLAQKRLSDTIKSGWKGEFLSSTSPKVALCLLPVYWRVCEPLPGPLGCSASVQSWSTSSCLGIPDGKPGFSDKAWVSSQMSWSTFGWKCLACAVEGDASTTHQPCQEGQAASHCLFLQSCSSPGFLWNWFILNSLKPSEL